MCLGRIVMVFDGIAAGERVICGVRKAPAFDAAEAE